jgi:hypothetical protein
MSLAMILGGAETMLYVADLWHSGIPRAARCVAIDAPLLAGRPSRLSSNVGWSCHWKVGVVSVTRSK